MLENRDFYISPTGFGTGKNEQDATYWEYAYAKIAHGNKIILLAGNYTNIINQTIDKTIIVEGQGDVVIDTNFTGRVFRVNGYQTTITGIKFVNGSTYSDGGLLAGFIYWTGNYGVLSNCEFINGATYYSSTYNVAGGAVYWTGNYGLVDNCVFINNSANLTGNSKGGAILWTGSYGNITNSNFTNNTADICNDIYSTVNITLKNNKFEGSYISIDGTVLQNHENAFIKITAPNKNMTVTVTTGTYTNQYTSYWCEFGCFRIFFNS